MYRATTSEHVDGPLAGVPFGVKDIIDVRAMPTGYGLEDRPARIALIDAWCVAILRAAGAVPAGKTRSTALASRDPALTRNPRIAGRTPGGSSAGSAAAVAAGHVPFALGTQTMGSVVRPAAFCGVVGFKPSYGRIPVTGVSPLAPSFDTIGVIADGVATATRVAEVLLASPLLAELGPTMRLGWAPSTFAERFSPELLAALDAYVATLERAGLRVERAAFERIDAMRDPISAIMGFEANATLTPFRESGALPPGIEAQLAHGETISYAAYRAALDTRAAIGAEALAELARFDAVLVPIAGDPPTPETTGDAMPQAPWTAWGAPSLALPIGTLPSGAPVAIGIVAPPGRDAVVLEVARRLEGIAGRTVAAR